ncbi:MAG: HD-GYP domain-containing protein, partial [Lachnospiraceae bacterium]|nr:HD-GYP domain-containing protein [Lachnospiraceae bacterium]
ATNNVSEELTRAIMKYDAVAVDIAALKISDEYTFKHSVDVASLAMIIGKKYGLKKNEIRELGIAGLLHDVGKSQIPLEILNKPGKLNDEEFHQMKYHSLFGYKILEKSSGFSMAIKSGVLQHHEKMNGHGYPMGVGADKIHKFARIISVADVYDALVTERPYKKGFPKKDAIEILMTMTDDLDIDVMKSFLTSIILYPVDSIVKLSNGEYAKVVENNPDYPLRPKVVATESGKVYDLNNDISCQSILIL